MRGCFMYLFITFGLINSFICKQSFNVGDAMSIAGRCVKVISSQTLVATNGLPFEVPKFCYLYKSFSTDDGVFYNPAESHYFWSNENVNCSSPQLICGPDPLEKSK